MGEDAMSAAITTIGLGGVSCYLLAAGDGFVLIDTGLATKRDALETALTRAGCVPGKLALIVLTHGDIDHVGNAAHLRETYGAKVAMHTDDARMVETGDMDWNRKPTPDHVTVAGRFIRVAGTLMELLRRGNDYETFTPDVLVDDGDDLIAYGLDARVLHLPGHSKGSIGVLTAAGDLVCGDLLYNWRRTSVPICDDAAAHDASMAKLRGLHVETVYPGHGKPFAWSVVAARADRSFATRGHHRG
jgi:glyoxylase-like metal-dependent hydrolase (beta-lactamase superfamily II)